MPLNMLTRPTIAAEPGYYLIPDGDGWKPYLVRVTGTPATQIDVVVKAREAGFARYTVWLGGTTLYRGEAPTGPWIEVATLEYRMQWLDGDDQWQTVDAEHLENATLAVEENQTWCKVSRTARVIGHDAAISWETGYGIHPTKATFLAEDRFRCPGFDAAAVRRRVRLVQRVVLAEDDDDLSDTEDWRSGPPTDPRRLRRVFKQKKLHLGWEQHAVATGDMPRMRVVKADRLVELYYHEVGRDDLDVDPHVVYSAAGTYVIPDDNHNIARNSSGHTIIVACNDADDSLVAFYTTATPPTQTSDWSGPHVLSDAPAASPIITASDGGGDRDMDYPGCAIHLDPRDNILRVVWNLDQMCYAQCNVSAGMSAIETTANWTGADGVTQQADDISAARLDGASIISIDSQYSTGYPCVLMQHQDTDQQHYTQWNGTSWCDLLHLFNPGLKNKLTLDDNDVVWALGECAADATAMAVRTCAFADSRTLGNWSAETEVMDDAALTIGVRCTGITTNGAGDVYVFGSSYEDGVYYNINNGSWATAEGTEISAADEAACAYGICMTDSAGYVAWLSYTPDDAVISIWDSKDAFAAEGSYFTVPAYAVSISAEKRPGPGTTDVLIASSDSGDLSFDRITGLDGGSSAWWHPVAAGNPWYYFLQQKLLAGAA